LPDVSYAEMLTVIEGLEAGAKRGELCLIDISKVAGSEKQAAAPGYGKMLDMAEGVEAKPQKGTAARQQSAKQAVERENRTAAEGIAEVQQPKRESIKAEMQGIVSGLHEAKPKFNELKIKRMNTKGLVLPGLPISDQIRELEQIVAALKENALDKEQAKVARLELEGLQQVVKDLEDELAKEKKSLGELDRSLWDMRRQRLEEALSLLKG
jgi:hypothetical protein